MGGRERCGAKGVVYLYVVQTMVDRIHRQAGETWVDEASRRGRGEKKKISPIGICCVYRESSARSKGAHTQTQTQTQT